MRLEGVWLVMAETGEYSDRGIETVSAWDSEAEAIDCVARLSQAAREQGVWAGGPDERRRVGYNAPEFKSEGFSMRSDYTGIRFYPVRVP